MRRLLKYMEGQLCLWKYIGLLTEIAITLLIMVLKRFFFPLGIWRIAYLKK